MVCRLERLTLSSILIEIPTPKCSVLYQMDTKQLQGSTIEWNLDLVCDTNTCVNALIQTRALVHVFTASVVEWLESMTSNPVTSLAWVRSPGDAYVV
jgi:hypothetical protein